jgi:hypothetical protein
MMVQLILKVPPVTRTSFLAGWIKCCECEDGVFAEGAGFCDSVDDWVEASAMRLSKLKRRSIVGKANSDVPRIAR